MSSPEPEYRQTLRETAAGLERLMARAFEVALTLDGQVVTSSAGPEWAPLEGTGLECRLVPGAFVLDTRGVAGSSCAQVQVEQAVYVFVTRGCLSLWRVDKEDTYTDYHAGQVAYLEPNEKHLWRMNEPTQNRSVFIPNHQLDR